MNKKLIWGIVIVVVVILIGLGLIKKADDRATNYNPSIIFDSWKTYSNKELGLEIKYPADWTVQEDAGLNAKIVIVSKDASVVLNPTKVGLPCVSQAWSNTSEGLGKMIKCVSINKKEIRIDGEAQTVKDKNTIETMIVSLQSKTDNNLVASSTPVATPSKGEIEKLVSAVAPLMGTTVAASPMTFSWTHIGEKRDANDPVCSGCTPGYTYKMTVSGYGFTTNIMNGFNHYNYFTSNGFKSDTFNSGDATLSGSSGYVKGDIVCILSYNQTSRTLKCANKKTGLISQVKTN